MRDRLTQTEISLKRAGALVRTLARLVQDSDPGPAIAFVPRLHTELSNASMHLKCVEHCLQTRAYVFGKDGR